MINFKQELKSYTPIDLDKLLKTNLNMPDNLKNSVLLYNKALDNMRIKSEDIAIIELKKAISLNPDFCEAINLLGLLYVGMGEYNKAKDCFEKVLDNDSNDRKALEYIKALYPNYNQSGNAKEKYRDKNENAKAVHGDGKKKAQTDSTSVKPLFKISDILKTDVAKYIIGFVVGILVISLIDILIGPKEPQIDMPNVVDDVYSSKSSEEVEKKYSELFEEHKVVLGQLEDLKKTAQNYTNLSRLLEIDRQVSGGNYVAAADMLVEFNTVSLNGTEKEKYDGLRMQTMEKAAQEMYNQGRDFYQKKQFSEALEKFDKVMTYVDEWKNLNATLYYIGVCHQELSNKDKALEAFNRVISEYSSSSFAKYSKNRINSINSQ